MQIHVVEKLVGKREFPTSFRTFLLKGFQVGIQISRWIPIECFCDNLCSIDCSSIRQRKLFERNCTFFQVNLRIIEYVIFIIFCPFMVIIE